MTQYQTGYFANHSRSTKVHIVNDSGKPVCGSKIGNDMEYQWCSTHINMAYVECEHCQRIYYHRLAAAEGWPKRRK